jgi:predicted metal-dependent enzyme (double-stranded beta helix superfamily)
MLILDPSFPVFSTTMADQTWLITDDGQRQPLAPDPAATSEDSDRIYRLYRFLTELEDILAAETDDAARLAAIAPRVRQLLISSYWLQMEYKEPDPKTGWAVKFLYREYQFPLTVQMVTWQPGTRSTIHNHATWGLVALIGGQEKNHFWRRSPTTDHPHRLESAGELTPSTRGHHHLYPRCHSPGRTAWRRTDNFLQPLRCHPARSALSVRSRHPNRPQFLNS